MMLEYDKARCLSGENSKLSERNNNGTSSFVYFIYGV